MFQDVLCRRDYEERVVESFSNQIQSEYYGGNRSVSIEDISLKHFIVAPQEDINSTTPSRQCHEVFHHNVLNDVVNNFLFLSNDINRLLCAVVVAASCLLSSDKKSEILHAEDMVMKMN